jgi:hypothetical protein
LIGTVIQNRMAFKGQISEEEEEEEELLKTG